MRYGVARLESNGNEYIEKWIVPYECQTFIEREDNRECECVPGKDATGERPEPSYSGNTPQNVF